ncbi:hypothetical protein HCN44_010617 [Aphidius gifuensis]|uniref:Replication factor C subunit 1 n=1 Tax=Aphidius gifuensis TaxID=684658 RepID=A0A834XVZ2_APHGI|nr:replication factor C subunit 1 [Aphidius gifuensis]KAF7991816.1 hypothetical protein HCN44_010617 [Aphidius gifuensis]
MPRDIRSFFQVKNTPSTSKPPEKKVNNRCISSSSDDDIVIATPQLSKAKKNVKKPTSKLVLLSDDDDDEDDFEKKPTKPTKKLEKTKNTHFLSDSDSDTPPKKKSAKEKIINKKKSSDKHPLSDSDGDNSHKKKHSNDKIKNKSAKKSTDDHKTPKKQNDKDKLNEKNKKLGSSDDEKTPKNKKKPNTKTKSHEKDKKVPSIAEMFSRVPIKRVNQPTIQKKVEEADYHMDDDDFIAVLDQFDNENIIDKTLKNSSNGETTSKRKNRDSDIEKEAKKIKIQDDEVKPELNNVKKEEKKLSDDVEMKIESNDDRNKKNKDKKEEKKLIDEDEIKIKSNDEKNKKEEKKLVRDDEMKIKSNDDKKVKEKSSNHVEKIKETLDISKNNEEPSSSTKKNTNDAKKSSKIDKKKTKKHEVEIEENKKPDNKKNATEDDFDFLEDRIIKKKQHAASYQSYLSRGGARNPGSKEIPVGAVNCLAGLTFVVTGVLDSLERFEADELIQKYGGRTVAALSKKTNYLVVGDQAGESKLNKADVLKIKKISEDELLDLIRTRKAGKATDIILTKSKKDNHNKSFKEDTKPLDTSLYVPKTLSNEDKTRTGSSSSSASLTSSVDTPNNKNETKEKEKIINNETPIKLIEKKEPVTKTIKDNKIDNNIKINLPYVEPTAALVEKYRPKTMKQIIGQQTDKSCAKKFYLWLKNWHKNQNNKSTKLTRPSPFAKSDDGAYFKACLLSGPPGIGKTTTVQVACKELGFDLLEFNASDTRSKKLLQNQISTILSNKTAKDYFSIDNNSNNENDGKNMSLKHVLLMDEVDGMAGNEDRGGLQELIALIKSTDIPIVCICNDRNNPKMRTLVNYTFDLRFTKPKLEQIRGAMMSLCYAEKIKITKDDIDKIIEMSGYDIRQVINYLSMRSGDELSNITNENLTNKINKDEKLTPWSVVEKVFSCEAHKNMSIHDKSNLFFHDYNIGSLFVQENYLTIIPKAPKCETLERIALSADSLSIGDVIEKAIRSRDAWSLLPVQACFSSVIPGTLMSGNTVGRTNFPSWLGKNSTARKFDRLLQEITSHTRLVTGASKDAVIFDYLKPLRDAVVRPLVVDGSDGVESAVETMIHYHMLKDDLEGLIECSLWPGQRDPMQGIESKVKAAFTRMYNKKAPIMPYKIGDAPKKKSIQASQESGFGSDGDEIIDDDDDEDEDKDKDDNLEKDRMIKVKKPTKTTNAGASTSKGQTKTTTRGRGRGRGRGK